MGFMMLLVIGVVVIIALKIAHIPRSHTVSVPAGSAAISLSLRNQFMFSMQGMHLLHVFTTFISIATDEPLQLHVRCVDTGILWLQAASPPPLAPPPPPPTTRKILGYSAPTLAQPHYTIT